VVHTAALNYYKV